MRESQLYEMAQARHMEWEGEIGVRKQLRERNSHSCGVTRGEGVMLPNQSVCNEASHWYLPGFQL
jgi:hypothetical protein